MSSRTLFRLLSAVAFGAVVAGTFVAERTDVLAADVALVVLTIALGWAIWGYLSWQRQNVTQDFVRRYADVERMQMERDRESAAELRGRLAAVCEWPTAPQLVVVRTPPRPRSHPLDDSVAVDARMWTDLRDDTGEIGRRMSA